MSRQPRGLALFERDWALIEGQESKALGPSYDASRCAACHREADVGHAPARIAKPLAVRRLLEPAAQRRLGAQLHRHGPTASTAPVRHEPRPLIGLRMAGSLFGWGLIDQIPDSTLERIADPQDLNRDGISGRRRMIQTASGIRPGRFGWKATEPTLRAQVASALANDMGIQSHESCRQREAPCAVELSADDLSHLVAHVAAFSVPDRRNRELQTVQQGERLFSNIGCSSCHIPALLTGAHDDPAFNEQMIWSYSDFLLHDLGEALADPGSAVDAREWRTAPLWGIGLMATQVPGHRFLHDGRAATLEAAITWHGGEAEASKRAFAALSASQRQSVMRFLHSL